MPLICGQIQTQRVVKSLRSANYRRSMWRFNFLRRLWDEGLIHRAEPLICVCHRELELSSVSETTEGEGLSLHHAHLNCPHLPPKLPPLCLSCPLSFLLTVARSLHSVPATFDTRERTPTAALPQSKRVTLHATFMLSAEEFISQQ